MIPWLTRLPTDSEIIAHAAAYPVCWPRGSLRAGQPLIPPTGRWLFVNDGDFGTSFLITLAVDAKERLSWNGSDWGAERDNAGRSRYLPCTPEGVPVYLLPKEPA